MTSPDMEQALDILVIPFDYSLSFRCHILYLQINSYINLMEVKNILYLIILKMYIYIQKQNYKAQRDFASKTAAIWKRKICVFFLSHLHPFSFSLSKQRVTIPFYHKSLSFSFFFRNLSAIFFRRLLINLRRLNADECETFACYVTNGCVLQIFEQF